MRQRDSEASDSMTTIVARIRSVELDPRLRKALGLSPNWKEELPLEFLKIIAKHIERNKEAIEELKRY